MSLSKAERDFFENWMNRLYEKLDDIENKIDKINMIKNKLDNGELMDNQDLCLLLGVTKRTIQRYRQKGLIDYYQIAQGKAHYSPEDVQKLLQKKNINMDLDQAN